MSPETFSRIDTAPIPKSETTPDIFINVKDYLSLFPATIEPFSQVQSILTTLPPSPEKTQIEQQLLSINENTLEPDIILCISHTMTEAKKIQTNNIKEQTIGEKEQRTVVEEQRTVVEEQNIEQREKIDRANERIDALFASFGSKEEFEKLNPDFQKWTKEAEWKFDPKDPALATKAMLLAIQEHQIDIDKSTTNLSPDLHAKYESIRHDMFRGIESSLVDLKVPYAITKELPKIPGTVVYNEFPGAKPGDITRTGSEFRIGDKVVDISTNPPTKYIESNGVRIESASRYEPPLENLSRQKDCISKLREITGIADFDGNLSTAKQFLDTTNNSLKATSAELIEKETLINTEQKDTPQNTDILEKLRSEISVLKAKQEKITTLITEFNKSMNELVQLQQEEKNSVPQFQEHVKEKDNAIRDNLKYLSSIGLDSLGQSGFDAILDFIKEKRKGQSGAGEITLQKSFSNTEKKDFSQVVRDIIGTDPFIKDSIPPTLQPAITPQNIRGLMMESGVLSQTGEFNKIRFMEKIQTKQPTEKTP